MLFLHFAVSVKWVTRCDCLMKTPLAASLCLGLSAIVSFAGDVGGWRSRGFVNLALQKGCKFAFQSSGDHGSTHISYALVYAEDNTRDAIVAAMKKRHTYSATDNIIADFRCDEQMMGDEFTTSEAPKFRIHLKGTAAFKKVVFVKDDVEIFTAERGKAECDVEWTDPKPEAGRTSYYYVRGGQENGELVWASPMWIAHRAAK